MNAKARDFFRFPHHVSNGWAAPPRINFTFISITYFVTDSEGVRFKVSTWAVGETGAAAAEAWKRRRPDVPRSDVSYKVVSAGMVKPKKRDEFLGQRAEPVDKLLASYG